MKQAGQANLEYLKLDGQDHDVAYSDGLDITKPAMEKFFARTLKGVTTQK
jgi:hypothetical protein